MLDIPKLLEVFILSAVLSIAPNAQAQEDNSSRSVTIIDGPSTSPAVSAGPAVLPTNAPTSVEQSSDPLIGNNDRPASTEHPQPALTSMPLKAPTTAANLDNQTPIKIENSAELSLEMLPGQSVRIGSQVSFRIKSKRAGYVILIDIDAIGKLTQIFPNIAQNRKVSPNVNFIKPGAPLLVPNLTNATGIAYIVSPPAGKATIVAMWSETPVQMLDMPDVVPEKGGQDQALNFLTSWASTLRIPENSGNRLHEAKWSIDAKSYVIE